MHFGPKALLFACLLSQVVSCKKPAPSGDFSVRYNGTIVPAEVVFTSTVLDATSYSWNFGDGSTSVEENPTHTFYTAGTYSVVLTAKGKGGTTTISHTVTVRNKPTSVKIKSFQIDAMPFLDANGSGWDPNSGPDVYFKITNNSTTTYIDGSGSIDYDVIPGDLPIGWNLSTPLTVSPLNQIRAFALYDYDSLDPDDFIGGIYINMSNYPDYPDVITMEYGNFKFRIGVTWE